MSKVSKSLLTALSLVLPGLSMVPAMAQGGGALGPIQLQGQGQAQGQVTGQTPDALPLHGLQKDVVSTDDLSVDDLNPDSIRITKPALKALIEIDRRVDPSLLDASSVVTMHLDEVVQSTLRNNLDIGISGYNERAKHAGYYSAMGKFLPDIKLAYNWNYLKGKANVRIANTPGAISFNNPLIITSAGFTYYGYRGGSVLFGALQSRNNFRAASHAEKATISDGLQTAAKYYYDLLLQEAILEIRVKAVETSEAQLSLNKDLKEGGLATNLDVLQAETQLSQDRQNLIDQQITRRNAAIVLAEFLNGNQDVDIAAAERTIKKIRVVSDDVKAARLVQLAIENRPELKQYEELRLAAKKQVIINAAKLQPTFAFNGNVFGIGDTLGKETQQLLVTNPSTGANSIANRQRQITALYTLGVAVNWKFEGMGTVDAANTYAAKMTARQAALEQQRELNKVISQVRRSYLNVLRTDRKIEEAVAQVRSSNEELRLAQLRFQNGVGRNIDVLKAQQDYTSSLIEKARAIVNFNEAQIDLLHDTGLISSSTVTARVPVVR
jgi:outer membrane protein TolC